MESHMVCSLPILFLFQLPDFKDVTATLFCIPWPGVKMNIQQAPPTECKECRRTKCMDSRININKESSTTLFILSTKHKVDTIKCGDLSPDRIKKRLVLQSLSLLLCMQTFNLMPVSPYKRINSQQTYLPTLQTWFFASCPFYFI